MTTVAAPAVRRVLSDADARGAESRNTMESLDETMAAAFARIALGHVRREYPHKSGHVLSGPDDARTPAELHPVFHGSYDWHSCVHGYWMLARLARRFPDLAAADAIHDLFDSRIVADRVAGECVYFDRPDARGFERPYGWAWLLALAAELHRRPECRWARALAPLTEIVVRRFHDFLPIATYPVRTGTHANTAFALRIASDYASTTGDDVFASLLRETAVRWYGDDVDCPAWGEPGGDDFLSPTLVEAECMRALLPAPEFAAWVARFLPQLALGAPATLFEPALVSDRSDGKIAHLDGLNLSRAWCWRGLAAALEAGDRRRQPMVAVAARHIAASLPHLAGDYMGEHWLATFAVLALDPDT